MHRRVGAIAMVLLVGTAVGARAQPAPDAAGPETETEAEALAHLETGITAYRAGDYAAAHREFSRAHDGAPDKPNPFRWLALAEGKLGDCASARVHIAEFLARVPADDPRAPELIQLRVVCDHAERDPGPAPGPASAPTPLVKKWWFWTAIVGSAAVIAGAIVLIAQPDEVNTYPPILCNASGCSP